MIERQAQPKTPWFKCDSNDLIKGLVHLQYEKRGSQYLVAVHNKTPYTLNSPSTAGQYSKQVIAVMRLFLWAWALFLLTWLVSLGWAGRSLAVLCGQEKVLQLFCIDGHPFRRQPALELLQSTGGYTRRTRIHKNNYTQTKSWLESFDHRNKCLFLYHQQREKLIFWNYLDFWIIA